MFRIVCLWAQGRVVAQVFLCGTRTFEPGEYQAAITALFGHVRQENHQAIHHAQGFVEVHRFEVDRFQVAQ